MTKQILVVTATGQVTRLEKAPTLKEMQTIVGGYIEHVTVLDRIENGKFIYTSMYINEEGLIHDLPRNEKATAVYQRNIREQFPDSPNSFQEANEAFRKQTEESGATFIDTTTKEYANDPYICGDVILFAGYTRDEVTEIFEEGDAA